MATFLNELPDWPDVEAELRKRNADAATVNQVRQQYWNDYSSTEEIKALPPIRTEAVKARFFGVPVTPVEPHLTLLERAASALVPDQPPQQAAPVAPVAPDPVLNPDGSLSIAAPGSEPTFEAPTTPLPATPVAHHQPFTPQPSAPPIVQDLQNLGPYALATLQKVATLYPGAIEELARKAKMAAQEATGIGVRPHPADFQTQMEAAPEDAIAGYRHRVDEAKQELTPKTKAGAAAQQATDVAGQIAEIVLPMIATGGAAGAVPGITPEVAAVLGPELAATTAVGRAAALRLASATAAGGAQSAAEDLAAGQPVNVPKAEQSAAAMGTMTVGALGGATGGAALAEYLDQKGLNAAANVMLKTGNAEKAAATLRKMVRAAGASKEVLEHVGGAVPIYMATLDQTGDKQKAFEQTLALVAAGAIGRRFGPGLDQQAVERLSANPEPVFDAANRYREAKQQAQGVAVAPEPPPALPAGTEQPPTAPPQPPETPPGVPQEPSGPGLRPVTPPDAGTPQETPAPRPAAAIEADLKRALADPLMKNESDAGQAHRVVVADLEHELEFARAQAAAPQSEVTPNANAAVPAENGTPQKIPGAPVPLPEVKPETHVGGPDIAANGFTPGDQTGIGAPPGDRWETDPGAAPGEPYFALDVPKDGTFEDAKAIITEREINDQGDKVWEAWLHDGRGGQFTSHADAARWAENEVDHGQVPKVEPGVVTGEGGHGPGSPGGVDRPQEVRPASVPGDGGQGAQGGIQAEAAGQPAEALPAEPVGQGDSQSVPEVAPAAPPVPSASDVIIKTRRDLGPLRVVDDSDPAKVTLALPAGGTLQVGRKAIESAPPQLAPPAGNVAPAVSAPPVEPPAAPHAPLQYEPKEGLSDTQRAVETHLADILGDTEAADAAYAAIPETHGGRVLNVDEVRKLSPEYSASLTGAAEHTPSTQKPAGNYIKGLYQRQLAKTDLPGNPRVVFLAGGAASGKTKATAKWVPREGDNAPQIIYDTTLGNLNRARQDIRAAVESGRGADIYLVHHPLDAAVKAMLRRTNTEGRYVPLDVMAADHRDAQESTLALAREFAGNKRVQVFVVDNSLGRDNAVLHEGQDALDFLNGVRYNTADETSEQTAKRLEDAAWRTYDEHRSTGHPATQRILDLGRVQRGGQSAGPLVRGLPEPSGARGDRGGRGQAPANAAPVPEPAGEVAHPTPVALGFEGTAKTPAGTAHPFRWAVFNAGDLITSHATSLNINPAFPAALQPRDRGRDAGKMQVERIAAKLDPELLGANPLTSDGAPVVGSDGVVESGNGRMIALRLVYQRGGALADGYRSWLKVNAKGFGIDPDALDGVDQPVLVRMRKATGETEQQRVEFTTESNQSNVDAQSASEKALSDARRMDQALMDQFQPSEDGDILTARNLPFIRSFMERVVGPTERGQYLLPGGQLNADGVTRVLNAVIARAYGDPNIVLRLAERTDDNVANLSRGITRAAGVWMRMRAGIEAGERHAVDVSPDLSRVIEIISSLRAEGTSIPDFLAQGSLFPEDRPTDLQKRILGTLDKHKRSGKRIGDILAAYADRVERAGDPHQPDMWGNIEVPDPLALWDKAVELVESGNWNGTPSLFDGPDHVGETAPTYNREEAQDYFAKQRAKIDAEVQHNLDAVGDKPFAIFASDGRSYVRLLHPDNSHPGGWRLTTFDERGPVGHYEFASKEDAIRSASGDGRTTVRADNVGAGGRNLSGWEPPVGDGTWRTVEQHPFVSEPRIDYKLDQGNLFEDQGDRTPRQASLFGPEDAQFEPIAKPSVPDAGPIPDRGTQLSLFEDEETAITEAKRLAADKARGVRALPLEPGVKETPSTYAAGPWQGAKTAADPSTLDEGDFITYDDWYNTTFAERKGAGGEVVDTNLTHPITTPNPPLGAWRIDRDPLNYGREIAQLRLLDPRGLEFSEDPLREGRAAYVAQYREWAKQGMSPPPITVIEKLDGSGRIIDGHRRALAARDAGVYVPAWVYPAMPSGKTDSEGKPTEVVHAVDITPEMTDTILHEGFAIFEPRRGYGDGRVPEQLFLPGFEPGGAEGDRVHGGAVPATDQRTGSTGRGVLTGAGGADSGAGAVVPPRGRGPATGLQVDRGPAGAGGMEPGSAASGAQQPGGDRGALADRVVGPQQAAYEKQAQGRREAALRRLGVPKELLGDTAQALADLEAPIQDALPETTSSAARRKAALTSLAGKLERTGWVHYVGIRVANANDLAQLTQGLRDPRFETFRIWFVNDEGEILASRAVSSRVPNQSSALTANEASKSGPGEYVSAIARMIGNIRRQMARLGATGFYLEHNHPSGNPTPSRDDVMLSRTLSEHGPTPMSGGTEGLPGYRGHVIIDHETARILLPGATDKADSHLVTIRPENRVAKDVTLPPGVRAPINPSSAITHPRDLASIAASIQLNHSAGRATIIFTTNPGDVRGVAEFDEDSLTRKGFADTLAGMSRATGGGVIILVVNGNPESSKVYKWNNLVRDGVVADVIYPDLKTSARLGWFASPKARDMWAGREAVKSAAATFEPSPAYGQLDGMATKWEGDITPERRLDAFVRVMQDRFVRIAKAQTTVEAATGQTLRDEEDAYLAEELRSGRTGARLDELEHEQVDPLAKLVRLARKRGVTYDDVRQYLYARHAPERNAAVLAIDPENKAGSGMTNDEAAAIIEGFDKRGVLPALTEIGTRADQITAAKLKGWVADGLMTQAQADAMRKKYPHYVPLKGRPGDEATAELMGPPRPHVGQGRDIRGQETKRALGRTTVATHDILSQLVMDAEEAIIRGEKNKVGQAFLRLVEDFPNPDVWEVNKVQMGKVLDRKTGKVKEVPETWSRNLDPSVIGVKRNGQQFYITMHDPLLARAMRNLGNAEVGTVFRALARLTRVYSAMRTSWNPEFLISNFMRDTGEASVNLSAEEYKGLGPEVRRNIGRAVAAIYGTERGHAWLAEWQGYWREFQEQGAKTSYVNLRDIDDQQRRLATKIGGKGGAVWMATKEGAQAVGKLIGDANDAVENGVRLASYVAARKRGMSRGRAASLAKNLTVNFNRGGEAGPVISSAYAFANAGVQGVARMSKALKSKRVWKVLAALAAVAAAQALINGLFGGEDPEDGRRYWDKLSPQLKERNFIVMIPGTKGRYIRIPLPYGYSWASTAATALVDEVVLPLLDTRPTRRAFSVVSATTRTVNGLLNSFNPFSGVSVATVKDAVGSFIPSVGKPLYGVAVNRTSMGSPIKPEQIPFGPPRPESELAFRGASPVSRAVTRKVNSLTGGNAIRPGAVSVSPEVLDYAWDEAGGGIARLLRGTADTLTAAASGKAPDARQVPFVRGLVSQAGDYDVGGRFREAVNAIETAQRETKLYEGSERVALLVKDRKELGLGGLLKATDARITALRKIQNRTPNNEAIGQKITALQKQFLRRYQESLNK